jgi:hypothetical protein
VDHSNPGTPLPDVAQTVGTAPSKSTSILNVKITFQQSEDPKETIQSAIYGLLKMFQKYDRSTKIATAGKRDHSSMVARPQLPSPKRLATGAHSTIKRWKQQTITTYTRDNTYKPSQKRRGKNECRLIIYETNNASKASK